MIMAIGERIRFFRNSQGMTMKYLGTLVGFPERSADIRMAQYESGTRTPKEELTDELAKALDVSPYALNVPDIDSYLGLMHTLFVLEDLYGLTAEKRDGETVLRFDPKMGTPAMTVAEMTGAWADEAEKLRRGEIDRDEYDRWRYNYPKFDASGNWMKLPPDVLNK